MTVRYISLHLAIHVMCDTHSYNDPTVCRFDHRVVLTEQYNDADEYSDDGSGAKAGGCHSTCGAAVPVIITGTNFDSNHRAVGQRRVPGIGHYDGDLVHTRLQVRNP